MITVPFRNQTMSTFTIEQKYSLIVTGLFILYAHLFVGNALVCFVVFKKKDMRSVTNLLLFNMALSDFMSTLFFVPSALAVEISPYSWPLGDFMCRAPPVIGTVSVSVSIYSMVALAVER